MDAGPGSRLDPPYEWMSEAALARLARRVERMVNAHGWQFDEFTPEEYIEGELGEAILHDYVSIALPIITEAHVGEDDAASDAVDVLAALEGKGDAHWHSSQLSGTDLDVFDGRVEAPDAGGVLQDVDAASPCRIDVSAEFVVRGRTWSGVEIVRVALTPAEIERRTRNHEEIEFKRMQALGIYPLDDELDG